MSTTTPVNSRHPSKVASLTVDGLAESIDQWQGRYLRTILIAGDGVALLVSVLAVLHLLTFRTEQGLERTLFVSVLFTLAGLWCMRAQDLWLARVSSIRVVELTRVTRALGITAVTMIVFDRVAHFGLYVRHLSAAAMVAWVLIVTWRSCYRTWLTAARSNDRYCRRVITIGADDDMARLLSLFDTHRELGVRIAGVVGDRDRAAAMGRDSMWLGPTASAEQMVARARVNGVIISASAVSSQRLNELIRHFQTKGVHVQVATGIAGIDARRVRSIPVAHEPLLYVEAPALGRAQRIGKRIFDIIAATIALVLLSPLLLTVAAAIKLNDRGPVLFRQERVGRAGRLFKVLKFRTMLVDAERRLADLVAVNERLGPLFKMENDPRVTRVGRFLRATSLDELPQLFNVLCGQMSLVGPRPALPSEVANFPADLRTRESVTPGLTGLWQVEARDNPSFEAYRRLDLFYVENWSITLDLLIVVGTVEQLAVRLLKLRSPRASVTALPERPIPSDDASASSVARRVS